MRLAELAASSGLPIATIKYYLRVGLLPPGERESSTWARYDEGHLRRLRLISALTDVAGLSLEEVRGAVDAVASSASTHEVRGAAQWSLSRAPAQTPSAHAIAQVEGLLARQGWEVAPESPHRRTLAAALDTLELLEFPATAEVLDAYAGALATIAEFEVPRIAVDEDPMVVAERLVVGTLLYEPVLVTLRRMAHEAASGHW